MTSRTVLAPPTAHIPVPASATARRQLEQYILSASSSSSSSSSSSTLSSTPDTSTLLRQSRILTTRVDDLHARITAPTTSTSASNAASTSAENFSGSLLWWTAVTLLTDLTALASRLKTATSTAVDRKVSDCRATTQQNIEIVKSLLRLLSQGTTVSDNANADGQAGGVFTAPITPTSSPLSSSPPVAHSSAGLDQLESTKFEYWKEKALAGLTDDDDEDDNEDDEDADADTVSEAESVLTDPDVHLNIGKDKALGGLKPSPSSPVTQPASPDDDDADGDYSEYDRPKAPTYPPTTSSSSAPLPNSNTQPTSDTILSGDRSTQEALSGELLRMASILKSNSVAFAEALERDRILLEKAGTDLGGNLDLMTRTRGKLGVYSKKVRGMGWFTLSAIGIVMLSWMLMFLVIRLT